MKNPMTATKEGNCKLDSPLIACPDVHPPAYLVPKPIKKPPTTKRIMPTGEVNDDMSKSDTGYNPLDGASTPNSAKSAIVDWAI